MPKFVVIKNKKYLEGHISSPFGYKFKWTASAKKSRKMDEAMAYYFGNLTKGKVERYERNKS